MCSGDSVFVGGAFQYNTGLYSDTLTSAVGCDSILETYLQVDSILFSYDSIALCSGDSALIRWNLSINEWYIQMIPWLHLVVVIV